MPGFVVDRYGEVAIARVDGAAAEARIADLANATCPPSRALGVRTLAHRSGGKGEVARLDLVRGAPPPDTIRVEEHGVPFVVDLARGQKTGAFLDQRDNRRRVGELARGRRVLNLFSYAGGFSVHAARGGAERVTSVDVASAAHATAQASFRAAGLDPGAHAFVTADAFLDGARRRADTWDVVVSDPPSFAPSEKAPCARWPPTARSTRLAPTCWRPAGSFARRRARATSTPRRSSRRSTTRPLAAGSWRSSRRGAARSPDLASFPEGRYLKFVVLA